jgi:hypothetical protein
MHQHEPVLPLVPHSNAVPQRPQARRRRGRLCSVGTGIIVAILGVIGREINHSVVSALRRPLRAARRCLMAFSSLAAGHGRNPGQ